VKNAQKLFFRTKPIFGLNCSAFIKLFRSPATKQNDLDVTLKGEPKRLLERQKIPAAADGEKESFEEDCLAHHA
jgi:hypothetical protein